MGKKIDLTGKVFGRLTVISEADKKGIQIRWNVKCECGSTFIVRGCDLRTGNTNSCGCYKSVKVIESNKRRKKKSVN
ncbi:transcription factor [Bacillus phage vB_BceP_LY3]|uniref:Transcription factor n=1 Tax=Bacillus phage vB_BceP_LY3 TaxID=2950458 RepID=A0AAE9LVQ5_9CAUD|nr:transcription factor [Bacillus phage vB_BceP_LY3]